MDMGLVFIPTMPAFPAPPPPPPPYYALLQQQETLMMLANRRLPPPSPIAFIPTLITGVHLHPAASTYHPPPPHVHQQHNMPESIWKFPDSDFNTLKLNTDGSSKGNPGPSSFGGLIRDCRGRWLGGYFGKMKGRSFTSVEAELWSIYMGLCLVKKKNLSNVQIETDCRAALMLRSGEMDEDDPWRPIKEAMERIMIDHKCFLTHTRRNGNHCADQLAKLGGNHSEEYSVFEEPPPQLLPYLIRDNQAAAAYEFQRKQPNY